MQQLDAAVAALRAIASIIASKDALVRLSGEVHVLSAKVEHLTRAADHHEPVTMFEQLNLAPVSAENAVKANCGTLGQKALQPLPRPALPACSGKAPRAAAGSSSDADKSEAWSTAFPELRPLLAVTSTAVILLAAFVAAVTMLQAVQPRVQAPAATHAKRTHLQRPQSSLISPIPISSQTFNHPLSGNVSPTVAGPDASEPGR